MELNKDLEYRLLDSLIDNNIHFALYRLPNSNNVNLILQSSPVTKQIKHFSELNTQKGFIIAPYSISGSSPIIIIDPEIILDKESEIFSYIRGLSLPSKNNNRDDDFISKKINEVDSSSFERYRSVFELFKEEVDSGACSKVILSRTFDLEKGNRFSAGASFAKSCRKYPNSYIYLCHTPISGTWLGCSPERLISGQNEEWITDALAGTQKITTDTNEPIWDKKNKLEQQIVADYMVQQLHSAGISPLQNKTETIKAGDLLHIRNEFKFHLSSNKSIGNILNLIHPSPAINGFPKEKAFRFIIDNEGYNRTYYSGFIGNIDLDKRTDLYVNLRCMQILDDRLRLYAGGGILSSSDLISEWKETENKLQTIISVIESI